MDAHAQRVSTCYLRAAFPPLPQGQPNRQQNKEKHTYATWCSSCIKNNLRWTGSYIHHHETKQPATTPSPFHQSNPATSALSRLLRSQGRWLCLAKEKRKKEKKVPDTTQAPWRCVIKTSSHFLQIPPPKSEQTCKHTRHGASLASNKQKEVVFRGSVGREMRRGRFTLFNTRRVHPPPHHSRQTRPRTKATPPSEPSIIHRPSSKTNATNAAPRVPAKQNPSTPYSIFHP